jgi:hypothetical protein
VNRVPVTISEMKKQLFCSLVVIGLLPLAASAQTVYSFTQIADTAGPYSGLGLFPVINSAGTVVFTATMDDGTRRVVSSTSGTETIIADSTGPFAIFRGATVNASGTVAFTTTLDAGGAGIYTGTGGAPVTIAETGATYSVLDSVPAINDSGAVAFRATQTGGTRGIFVFQGVVTTPIADSTGPLNAFTATPAFNIGGTVAFAATLDVGGSDLFTGNGGPLATIADTAGVYSGWADPSMNDAGIVASVGFLDGGGSRIVLFESGNFTTVADSETSSYSSFGGYSINGAGAPAFIADLDDGGRGIYTGGNPANEFVLRKGDPLFGSTVDGLFLSQKSIDDAGQIAFSYFLANGTSGIAVATPGGSVAQPPTVTLTGKAKISTTKPSILLKGTAVGTATLSRVEVSYRQKTSKGTKTFTRTAQLVGGTWTFKFRAKQPRSVLSIRAIDTNGLSSNLVRAKVIRK